MFMSDITITNPGELLRDYLMEIFPLNSHKKEGKYISDVEYLLLDDEGELSEVMYQSVINYVIRRLIFSGVNLENRLKKRYGENYTESNLLADLKKQLQYQTAFNKDQIDKLITIILNCLHQRKRRNSSVVSQTMKKAIRNGSKCYICGADFLESLPEELLLTNVVDGIMSFNIDGKPFSTKLSKITGGKLESDCKEIDVLDINGGSVKTSLLNSPFIGEVDHLWPLSLGGATIEENLVVVCQSCNKVKTDYLNSSDFHYEKIVLTQDEDDPHFSNELNNQFKVAIWAKSNYQCVECGLNASVVGELVFVKKNEDDIWHYLNIDVYCQKCARKLARKRKNRG